MEVKDEALPEGWSYKEDTEELQCRHDITHPIPSNPERSHTCDGCCAFESFDEAVKIIRAKRTEQ